MSDFEKIQLFESKKVRTLWVEEEDKWYFVLEDVIEVLTESKDPKQYIKRMKLRDPELAKGWVQIVPLLSIKTEGGPQKMRCANLEGMLRIIQSIPSKKAEPFKRWMAQVGSVAVLPKKWTLPSSQTSCLRLGAVLQPKSTRNTRVLPRKT